MRHTIRNILSVDDDENDRIFIAAAFLAIGVRTVQGVGDGETAVAYLTGTGIYSDRIAYPYPDIVITDLKMPHGDGFAVLEHLKRMPERAIIPTIVLTGSEDNDDIKRAYWLGASSYHVKPSSPDGLRRLVKALHEYWLLCDVPELDPTGRQVESSGTHKLGERFGRVAKPGGALSVSGSADLPQAAV